MCDMRSLDDERLRPRRDAHIIHSPALSFCSCHNNMTNTFVLTYLLYTHVLCPHYQIYE